MSIRRHHHTSHPVPQPPPGLGERRSWAERTLDGGAPPWVLPYSQVVLSRLVVTVFVAVAIYWAVGQLRHLIGIILLSFFFSLALDPAVTYLHDQRNWRRGAATGLIYLALVAFVVLLVGLIIPVGADFASRMGQKVPQYAQDLNDWFDKVFGSRPITSGQVSSSSQQLSSSVSDWLRSKAGSLFGVATTGLSLVFDLLTTGLFTFYLTANAPRVRAALTSRLHPESRERVLWALDVAVRETGGYFYSRLLLALINGSLFFVGLVVVGVPTRYAVPLAMFEGIVAEFIPAVGTYIGAAVPILYVLADQGLTQALILVGYTVVYQQLENAWLSPKLSARTMSLNAGVAFGSALAGGALGGPVGAFVALPVAGMVTAFLGAWRRTEEVGGADVPADDGPGGATAPPAAQPPGLQPPDGSGDP